VAIRKTLRLLTGFVLLAVGIVGLILPIMPGWIFVIPGLIILGDYFPPVRRLLGWAKAKARTAGVNFHREPDNRNEGNPSSRDEPPGGTV
jgi:hypothetical protein